MRTAIADLVRTAATTLLAHHDAGRHCDPRSVQWARQVLAINPPAPCAPINNMPEETAYATRTF